MISSLVLVLVSFATTPPPAAQTCARYAKERCEKVGGKLAYREKEMWNSEFSSFGPAVDRKPERSRALSKAAASVIASRRARTTFSGDSAWAEQCRADLEATCTSFEPLVLHTLAVVQARDAKCLKRQGDARVALKVLQVAHSVAPGDKPIRSVEEVPGFRLPANYQVSLESKGKSFGARAVGTGPMKGDVIVMDGSSMRQEADACLMQAKQKIGAAPKGR